MQKTEETGLAFRLIREAASSADPTGEVLDRLVALALRSPTSDIIFRTVSQTVLSIVRLHSIRSERTEEVLVRLALAIPDDLVIIGRLRSAATTLGLTRLEEATRDRPID